MPTRKCCIINCESGQGNAKISTFRFPSVESEDFQAWAAAACSRLIVKKKINFRNYYICEMHFSNECFDQTSIEMWKDGQKVTIPRKVKRLKKGAVPSIFPNSQPTSSFLKNITNIRDESVFDCDLYLSIELNENLSESEHPSSSDLSVAQNAKLPQNWTMVNTTEGTLYKYYSKNTFTRSCLIKKDFTVEVKAMNRISKYPPIKKAEKLIEVKYILEKVAAARVCASIYEGQNCKNVLFLPPSKKNHLCVRCPSCQLQQKIESKKIQQLQARLKRDRDIKRKYARFLRKRIAANRGDILKELKYFYRRLCLCFPPIPKTQNQKYYDFLKEYKELRLLVCEFIKVEFSPIKNEEVDLVFNDVRNPNSICNNCYKTLLNIKRHIDEFTQQPPSLLDDNCSLHSQIKMEPTEFEINESNVYASASFENPSEETIKCEIIKDEPDEDFEEFIDIKKPIENYCLKYKVDGEFHVIKQNQLKGNNN